MAGEGDIVVSFEGVVREVRKQLIPRMYVTTVESGDGKYRIEFDIHEELVLYREGERLRVTVARSVPEYREGVDYVVHATLVSTREEGGRHAYLFSAGGLLFMLESNEKLEVTPTEKFYIKVERVE